jgi:hypothetical protein
LSLSEEKFLELSTKQKNILEIEARLIETEKRPTSEELKKAVQQEADKYKDYVKLTPLEQKKLSTYDNLKAEVKKLEEELTNLSPYQPNENNSEEIIKKVEELLNKVINPLWLEIAELSKRPIVNNSQPNNSPAELPTDYEAIKTDKEELFRILEIVKLKIFEEEEKNKLNE